MAKFLLLGLVAAAAAFGCVYAAALAGSASLTHRSAAMIAQGESVSLAGLLKWRLRNGFMFLRPLVYRLVKMKAVADVAEEAALMCGARNVSATRESILSVILVGLCILVALVTLMAGSFIGGIAVCVCLVAGAYVFAGSVRDKRCEAVREAVPGALESMAACFGSGFTLLQTFRQIAGETPGYLGEMFGRSAHVLETGGSAEQALDELRSDQHAGDLAFVAIALDVQHQSGGSMRQVLDAAGDSVKGELALRRSLRVQTAQAKLSARVVVMMPFILVAVFSLASPGFLEPFFSSAMGYALLTLAIVMEAAGVFLVNRALSVDGVS